MSFMLCNLTVESSPPETTTLPLGDIAIALTGPKCPAIDPTSLSSSRLNNIISKPPSFLCVVVTFLESCPPAKMQ